MKYLYILLLINLSIDLSSQENLGCSGLKFEHHIDSIIIAGQVRNAEAIRNYLIEKSTRSAPGVVFQWPLRAAQQYAEMPDYYTISNYVDQDPATPQTLDYNCGNRTYDGHRGIDITLWPFMWHMMDNDYVEVVAAADGLVTTVNDEEQNDNNCMGGNSANTDNNTVIITHADSSISVYFHIKSFSVTVAEGDLVKAGDKIALVASSGYSSGPHLHFGVRDANNNLIEPFSGTCNGLNNESWWQNQKPYWNPRVNRVMCHSADPSLVGYNIGWCDTEFIHGKNNFSQNDDIFFGVAMTDIQTGMTVDIDVYFPNGNSWFSSSYTHAQPADNALYLTVANSIPANAPSGTYQIRVDIGQEEFYHYFTVNCPTTTAVSADLMYDKGFHAGTTLVCSSTLKESGLPPSYTNTKLKLQSGIEIKLLPGFHSPSGTNFYTKLRGCNYTH